MKKVFTILFLFIVAFVSCQQSQQIKYSEAILLSFPAEPAEFQKEYGGTIKYFNRNTEVFEKTTNIDKANVDSNDFEATFWKNDKFQLQLLKIKTNRITINGTRLIGKTKKEIIQIFGDSYDSVGSSINYSDNFTYIAFNFKNEVVIEISIGRDI